MSYSYFSTEQIMSIPSYEMVAKKIINLAKDKKTRKKFFAEELHDEQVVAKFATTTKHGAIDGKTQTHMNE